MTGYLFPEITLSQNVVSQNINVGTVALFANSRRVFADLGSELSSSVCVTGRK